METTYADARPSLGAARRGARKVALVLVSAGCGVGWELWEKSSEWAKTSCVLRLRRVVRSRDS